MPDKSWKKAERRVAVKLGGKRIPVTGERNGADVLTPLLAIQVKHGRNRPAFLRDWIDGICTTAQACERTGLVVWQSKHERTDDALVLMRLSDFEALHGDIPKETLK